MCHVYENLKYIYLYISIRVAFTTIAAMFLQARSYAPRSAVMQDDISKIESLFEDPGDRVCQQIQD